MRFTQFMDSARESGRLVVQPRMGFARCDVMRAGLEAVRAANATTVGTITLDSYTRVGDHASARKALALEQDLNGFPIVAHGSDETRAMLDGVQGPNFPVQVRHGCSQPYDIFVALIDAGLDATEGGPISYCLPYGRTPLTKAIDAWTRCCELLGQEAEQGRVLHLESFGGCLLGQLCPPSLLVAMAILEGIFFQYYGVKSLSLSYAQQTSMSQDLAALSALRRLASEHLTSVDWHVVLYTYMGVFPKTTTGALELLTDSVYLAVKGQAERLIVKTPAEAHRIPTVAENVGALEHAARYAQSDELNQRPLPPAYDGDVYDEARTLIESVLALDENPGRAFQQAFARGYLDVPYCLHADNAGHARSYIDSNGALRWQNVGAMPIRAARTLTHNHKIKPQAFLDMLGYVEHRFDQPN